MALMNLWGFSKISECDKEGQTLEFNANITSGFTSMQLKSL